jgi:hypothetical protein
MRSGGTNRAQDCICSCGARRCPDDWLRICDLVNARDTAGLHDTTGFQRGDDLTGGLRFPYARPSGIADHIRVTGVAIHIRVTSVAVHVNNRPRLHPAQRSDRLRYAARDQLHRW